MKTSTINAVSQILAAIGAINWGLVGLMGFNLVTYLFGDFTAVTRAVYALVGIAGVLCVTTALAGITQEAQLSTSH